MQAAIFSRNHIRVFRFLMRKDKNKKLQSKGMAMGK
jgi:hypothetical protein